MEQDTQVAPTKLNGSANGAGRQTLFQRKPVVDPLRSDCVWVNGELVAYDDATVHVLNPTMHYGPGVFEGIRCYATARGPAVFRLHAHLKRFLESAKVLGLTNLPYTLDEIRVGVHRTVHANGFSECYIRPVLFFTGSLGLNLDAYEPVVAIGAWKWGALLGAEKHEAGVRMMVSSFTRTHPNAGMTKGKINGQYVNSILAKSVAVRAGFDEAIMLDPEGYVAECTGENLFLVRDGVIYTPPRAGVLEGITRDTVIILAHDLGYQVVEDRLSRDQLYLADEVFVCGTAAEVVPVREIDFRSVGNGRRGPVTHAVQSAYFETVRGRGERSRGWLEYTMLEPMF
jgi:branched-chain amino acid aminotransferase